MGEGEEATEIDRPPEALLLREPVGEEVEDRDSDSVALKVCVTVPVALARLVALTLTLTLCVRLPLPEMLREGDPEGESEEACRRLGARPEESKLMAPAAPNSTNKKIKIRSKAVKGVNRTARVPFV